MGKKTVPIAVQNTPNRKVSRIRESVIGVWPVIGNFKIIPRRDGSKRLSGRNMFIKDKRFINYQRSTTEAKTGYGNAYGLYPHEHRIIPSTHSCHCRCHLLQKELRDLGHTSTTPEEEHLYPGSPERIYRCLSAGKDCVGEEGIYRTGNRSRWQAWGTTTLCRYTRSDVPLPPETDHHPLPYEQPQTRGRY